MSSAVQALVPSLKSIIVGPSSAADSLITVVPSLLREIQNFISSNPSLVFLRNLSLLDTNLDTIIPPYFVDKPILVHLAFLVTPQLGGQALEKIALDYLEEDAETDADVVVTDDQEMEEVAVEDDKAQQEDDDQDVVLLDVPLPVFKTPKKKRVSKLKEKLDDSFLRHNRRTAKKFDGYKEVESAKKNKEKT